MQLELITGASHFSNTTELLAVVFPLQDGTGPVCRWAEQYRGRPAATQTIDGRGAQYAADNLKARWLEWAAANNIQISFKQQIRKARKPF